MSDDATLPPRKPRTIRNAIAWLLVGSVACAMWIREHPAVSVPAGTFLLGVLVGWWVG